MKKELLIDLTLALSVVMALLAIWQFTAHHYAWAVVDAGISFWNFYCYRNLTDERR
jgi:hypothetical protein